MTTLKTKRYCLALDLKDDPALIAEYKRHHQKIWPEITKSIRDSGIEDLEIYLLGARLFMIMEVNATFSFAEKARAIIAEFPESPYQRALAAVTDLVTARDH